MSYTDFSIDSITNELGLEVETVGIFPDLERLPTPAWLRESLDRGIKQVLLSEKARSEFLVVPILLACQEQGPGAVAIFSGQRLDVDAARGLVGECDYLLAATPPLPGLRAPLVMVIEVNEHDFEGGIWQCIARMVGARVFNERAGHPIGEVFGCVTSGEAWQFLRVAGDIAQIDRARHYIDDVGSILAAFGSIFRRHSASLKGVAGG